MSAKDKKEKKSKREKKEFKEDRKLLRAADAEEENLDADRRASGPEEEQVEYSTALTGKEAEEKGETKEKLEQKDEEKHHDPCAPSRDHFVERVTQVVDRDDAFVSLPMTTIFLIIFLFNVWGHLRMQERQMLEFAMEAYVNGRDPREMADMNVDDIDSWWEWVQGPGTTGPFGKHILSASGFPRCRLASRNFLLGDIRLQYEKFDGSSDSVWLLHSAPAQAVLANNATEYLTAARQAALYYQANGWSDKQIAYLHLSFCTYNDFVRMIGMTRVTLPLRRSGYARTIINTEAVSIEPYPFLYVIVFDVIYVALVVFLLFHEGGQLARVAAGGCGEVADYFHDFWNVIDWVTILLSLVLIVSWSLLVKSMNQSIIKDLVDDEYHQIADVMQWSATQMDDLEAAVSELQMFYRCMQIIFAINLISIVMKFFKAFRSNARLNMMAETFKAAAEDLVHFAIIFSTIYIPFTIIAHMMFGQDLKAFSSALTSLNTTFYCLFGEFGFYVEATQGMTSGKTMNSGMPLALLLIWYFAYMFFVVLVMLNMLLAVVMEHYIAVVDKMRNAIEKPTVWRQAKDFWHYRRQTKKHIHLEQIMVELEDDDEPAHPQEDVTPESLKEAWPAMSDEQVQWIMSWFQDYLDKKAEESSSVEEKTLELAQENRRIMEENRDRKDMLIAAVQCNRMRLDSISPEMFSKMNPFKPAVVPWQAEMETVRAAMQETSKVLAKVRRDLERQSRRVEEISLAVPAELRRAKLKDSSKKLGNETAVGADSQEKKLKKEKKKLRQPMAELLGNEEPD